MLLVKVLISCCLLWVWKKQERATHVSLHNKVKVEVFDSIWPVPKIYFDLRISLCVLWWSCIHPVVCISVCVKVQSSIHTLSLSVFSLPPPPPPQFHNQKRKYFLILFKVQWSALFSFSSQAPAAWSQPPVSVHHATSVTVSVLWSLPWRSFLYKNLYFSLIRVIALRVR